MLKREIPGHILSLFMRACVIFLMLWATAVSAAKRPAGPAVESRPHPCQIQNFRAEILCATYPVWEDRDRKSGRKIGLNIVILPALGPDPAPDPIFALAGGPGGSATSMIAGYLLERRLRERRHIVFVDQRGSGASNPLDCDWYGDPPDLQKVVSTSFPVDSIRTCRVQLEKVADLRFYTTAAGMDDLDEVRQWLGYEKINLTGASYGSMAGQVYLRRHGSSVRAAAFAGIAPVDELIPLHHAWAGQRAVDIIFDKCRADADCNAAFPNVREEFQSVFEQVRKGVEVKVHNREGGIVRVRPTVEALAEGIRHRLYADDGRSFPAMVHRAAQGDLGPLVQTAITAEMNLMNTLSLGMLLSVTCAEQIPYIDDATLARETADTFLGDLRVKEQRAACREWVRGRVPRDVHRLVRSKVPVLLISGERDSVTPPSFAERVAKQLPNSLHIVFPEASHGNWEGACGSRIITDFVERGSVQGLDVSCVAQQKPTKFVTELQ